MLEAVIKKQTNLAVVSYDILSILYFANQQQKSKVFKVYI